MTLSKIAITATVFTGALAGLGAFTFDYGEGLSYFSTDRRGDRLCAAGRGLGPDGRRTAARGARLTRTADE